VRGCGRIFDHHVKLQGKIRRLPTHVSFASTVTCPGLPQAAGLRHIAPRPPHFPQPD